MHSYIFDIHHYHAIAHAHIKIDGITVLSGVNGCGKSTLTRWLYYIVNATSTFRERLTNECITKIYQYFSNLTNIESDTIAYLHRVNKQLDLEESHAEVVIAMMPQPDMDQLASQSAVLVQRICKNLSMMASAQVSDLRKKRLIKSLSTLTAQDITSLEQEYLQNAIYKSVTSIISKVNHEISQCKLNVLQRLIRAQLGETDAYPTSLQLSEDEVPLMENNEFVSPLGLKRAIYIDTPMGVGRNMPQMPFVIARDTDHWNQLQQMLINPVGGIAPGGNALIRRIRRILNGEVSIVRNDSAPMPELVYRSKDGLNIPIAKAATGFKSFSYLLKLLENGYLDEKAVLIIDEPEVHLHPDWSFEFANCLVLLHQLVGVYVVIASHNPDMVQSIRVLAEKNNVLDRTNFYLAAEPVQEGRYVFESQDKDISKIFNSFNAALRKIQHITPKY